MIKNLENVIDKYMLTYSNYAIYHRAIPSLMDGLKPSQRMILEVVKNINNFEKSNTVAGKVMLIHCHGDSYPTIVNMVQNDNNNHPLILGKGSFSGRTTRDGVAASSRYTECKISPFGKLMTSNKEEIDLIPSYDGKVMIPTSFSPDIPLILINGSLGVATGFATNIPQYNLEDVCKQTINLIQGGKYEHIYPDFSTGGYIHETPQKDGSSMKYILRAKCEIEGNNILVKEIPYNTTREEIIEKIEDLYKEGVLSKELKDVDDLTDKNGLLIEISLKRGVDPQEVLNKLYVLTPLQTSYSTNIGYINKDKLVYSGVEELLSNWIAQKSIKVVDGAKKKLVKVLDELQIVGGLVATKKHIKIIANFILNSKGVNIEEKLMKEYGITEVAANFITNLSIKNFNEDYFSKRIEEGANLLKKKDELEDIILDGGKKEMIRRIEDIVKKYPSPRKTLIEEFTFEKIKVVKKEDLFEGSVVITKKGYIYKTKNPNNIFLSVGDKVSCIYQVKNQGEVLIFDKNGDCYKFALEDIKVTNNKELGYYTNVKNIVGATYIEESSKYIIKVFENGRMVKEDVGSYITATKRKKLGNSLYLDSKLLDVFTIEEDCDITIKSNRTRKVVNTDTLISKKARNSQGIKLLSNIIAIEK